MEADSSRYKSTWRAVWLHHVLCAFLLLCAYPSGETASHRTRESSITSFLAVTMVRKRSPGCASTTTSCPSCFHAAVLWLALTSSGLADSGQFYARIDSKSTPKSTWNPLDLEVDFEVQVDFCTSLPTTRRTTAAAR